MNVLDALQHELNCTPNTKAVKDPQRSKFNGYRAGLQRAVTGWQDASSLTVKFPEVSINEADLREAFARVLLSVIRGTPEGNNENNKAYWLGYREGLEFAVRELKK